MEASINFDGTLSGAISGGGGGGGSNVVITPVVTSGTKIADVSVDGVEKDLYCPTVTPTEVEVTQIQQSGTKIASIDVDGESVDLYAPTPSAPTEVEVTQVQQSGTKIATIGVNGVDTDLYAPEGGGGGGYDISYDEIEIGTWIDGISKIYRKTYDANVTIPADGVVQLNLFIPNRSDIKLVIECIGINTSVSDNRCENLYCWKDAGYIRAFSNFGITTNLIILTYIKNS